MQLHNVNAVKDLSTAQLDMDSQDVRVENAPSLILPTNKWLRLTYEVKSGRLINLLSHSYVCFLSTKFRLFGILPLFHMFLRSANK